MTAPRENLFRPRLGRRRWWGRVVAGACLLLTAGGVGVLALLLADVFSQGWQRLSPGFLTAFPSMLNPAAAGVRSALAGSVWLVILTGLFSIPIGVGAAVYLQEYARDSRIQRLVALNIANLAGVPSIVYGILGLAVFVRWMLLDRSVLSGSLTMTLVVLPVVIITAREALAAVPDSIRQAAYALGATRWQTVRHHVLPSAAPGIMTGLILAMSRAIGETAPLILIGAVTYQTTVPGGSLFEDYPQTVAGLRAWLATALFDSYTVLPLQIFDWAGQPKPIFHELAAAGIIVLLGVLMAMNAAAVAIRAWRQRGRL